MSTLQITAYVESCQNETETGEKKRGQLCSLVFRNGYKWLRATGYRYALGGLDGGELKRHKPCAMRPTE